jgi:hypothetical protein
VRSGRCAGLGFQVGDFVMSEELKIAHPLADPVSEELGFMCVMKENDAAVQLSLALKTRNGEITEGEHFLGRNLNARSLANLQTPRPALLAMVGPAERVLREEMLTIGALYYEALGTSGRACRCR